MTAQRRICVIGNANLDIVLGHLEPWPEPGTETYLPHSDLRIGGSAANSALVLQRLGSVSGLVSAYGADLAGDLIRERFSGSLDRLQRIDKPTSYSVGILHPPNERSFLSSVGHLDDMDLPTLRALLEGWPLEDALVLISGGFAMPALMNDQASLQSTLRDKGAKIALDPGWPAESWSQTERSLMGDWMALCDHLLVNDKEACALTGVDDVADAAVQLGQTLPPDAIAVVKRGSDGALAVCGGDIHVCETERLDVIDTVGAGDSFNAGYLDAIARGKPLTEALKRATTTAAAVLSQFPRTHDPIDIDRA